MGAFDTEDRGQAVCAFVVRAELARRGVSVRLFAPTGRPARALRGEPVEAVAAAGDLPLVDCSEPATHPAVLLPRHLPREVLDKRLEYLRLMGWLPKEGGVLVVEGGAERILADHPAFTPVELPEFLSIEDVAAAVAASEGFVGSAAGCAIALAYGRPAVPSDDPDEFVRAVKAAPDTELLARSQAEVDAWLDSVAQRVPPAPAADPSALESELHALRRAHRARTERANAERVVLADRVAAAEADAAAARAQAEDLRRRLDEEAAARARFEAECDALHATRTFRWTASARRAYRWLRR